MKEKAIKFVVIKLDDISKYLLESDKDLLANLLAKIRIKRGLDGKNSMNKYIVCNEDEPYAEQVWDLVLKDHDDLLNYVPRVAIIIPGKE